MTLMLRRFVMLAVAVTIGIAPIAHEFCQVSCAKPIASTPQAGAAHEHCAQAAIDDLGNGATMSAARVYECRSQANDALWTSTFAKVAAAPPAILPHRNERVVPSVHALASGGASALLSVSVPPRTQLRV